MAHHLHNCIAVEADRHSRAAFDCALHCLDIGNRKPILGPAMVGYAFGYAGLGLAIASVGVFAGILEAAQADQPAHRNTPAH